jgi:aminoglycoside phosphotransferase family enzyme
MPAKLPIDILDSADRAIENAQRVRRFHRRRTERASMQRKTDIEVALQRLKEAMRPLRTEIGRFPYGPQTDAAEANREAIRERSASIQSERRKLWKMLRAK